MAEQIIYKFSYIASYTYSAYLYLLCILPILFVNFNNILFYLYKELHMYMKDAIPSCIFSYAYVDA